MEELKQKIIDYVDSHANDLAEILRSFESIVKILGSTISNRNIASRRHRSFLRIISETLALR